MSPARTILRVMMSKAWRGGQLLRISECGLSWGGPCKAEWVCTPRRAWDHEAGTGQSGQCFPGALRPELKPCLSRLWEKVSLWTTHTPKVKFPTLVILLVFILNLPLRRIWWVLILVNDAAYAKCHKNPAPTQYMAHNGHSFHQTNE